MPSIGDPRALEQLIARLERVEATSVRRWGTLTPGEMLCHVADATAGVLSAAPRPPVKERPVARWIALCSPLPWPRGVPTLARIDPRRDGTRPGDFARDRARAVELLRQLAGAAEGTLPAGHARFGAMRHRDWLHWAWKHTDHHLRQFGV